MKTRLAIDSSRANGRNGSILSHCACRIYQYLRMIWRNSRPLKTKMHERTIEKYLRLYDSISKISNFRLLRVGLIVASFNDCVKARTARWQYLNYCMPRQPQSRRDRHLCKQIRLVVRLRRTTRHCRFIPTLRAFNRSLVSSRPCIVTFT